MSPVTPLDAGLLRASMPEQVKILAMPPFVVSLWKPTYLYV
jgi:hypothetical protein